MTTSYFWRKSYRAALLETDRTKMEQRIQTAESEIHNRRLILSQDHSGTDAERAALVGGRPRRLALTPDVGHPVRRPEPLKGIGTSGPLLLADPRPVETHTCLYTTTADERFILERRGRIVVGSACSGHGFKFAPAIGARLAALAEEAL